MHLLTYVFAVFESSWLMWSRDSVLFLKMCNSTSYSITMKTWKAPKLCKWRKRMWIMDLQCGWQRTRDKLEECYEYIYLFFWLVGSGNDIIICNLAVQSTGKKQLDFQFLISYKVSGYVCNHGSPSGEQDTVSPRGRYGESRQCDSCLKHTYKNTTCWPATAYDVTTSTTKVERAPGEYIIHFFIWSLYPKHGTQPRGCSVSFPTRGTMVIYVTWDVPLHGNFELRPLGVAMGNDILTPPC